MSASLNSELRVQLVCVLLQVLHEMTKNMFSLMWFCVVPYSLYVCYSVVCPNRFIDRMRVAVAL